MKKIFDLFEYFEINEYYDSDSLLIGCCPVHQGDNATAFNINVNEEDQDYYGRWFCNTKACHNQKVSNDILSLVWLLLDKKLNKTHSFAEVLRFSERFCSGVSVKSIPTNVQVDAIDKLLKHKKRSESPSIKVPRSVVREHLLFPAQFYVDRGYSREVLDFFDVGLCTKYQSQMYQRIVFPVYDEDDKYMVGCTGRTINNNPRKWINQKGFNKSNFLYNYGKAIEHISSSATIILVEGQGDVIRLWEAGIKNAVGIFGSKISDAQEFLIQKTGVANIVIMSDNDAAGEACRKDIQERLQYLFNIDHVILEKKDVGDMTVEEINKIIKPQIKGKF